MTITATLRTTVFLAVTAMSAAASARWDSPPDFPIPAGAIKSSAEVCEETVVFLKTGGHLYAAGEGRMVIETPAVQRSRAEVLAETLEAKRLGLLRESEATLFASPAQEAQIRQAGLRAVRVLLATRNAQ
jgi:hypothetical protein